MSADTRRRVKLYTLNEDRQWEDRGTGHVNTPYISRLNGVALLVRSETDGSILLESKIQMHTAYQKQQETLIVWSEGDKYDLALSFQEKAGCDEIWEKICQVQGKDPSLDITQDVESEDEQFGDSLTDTSMGMGIGPIQLPPCDLAHLGEIADCLKSALALPAKREKMAIAIENENCIKKLIEMFHMCEDLENEDGLHHLYEIMKTLCLMNKNSLYEIMFSNEFIMDVIGCFEYDPTLPEPIRHRDYILTKAKFKGIVPSSNAELVAKIHQTYRVQYVQDVILPMPSMFEENTLSSLSSFVFFNKIEIVTMIQDDDKFLTTFFRDLLDDETPEARRRDMVLFLKELCQFSQILQKAQKDNFLKTLFKHDILTAVEYLLPSSDEGTKLATVDVLSYLVEQNPSMVREFVLQESQDTNEDSDLLINLLVEQMKLDPDPNCGCAMQLCNIIRILVDPDTMVSEVNMNWNARTEFLSFFYQRCMSVLLAPIMANTVETRIEKDDIKTAQLEHLILELLSFCVEHHSYHMRNYVIGKDLLSRILVLLKSRHAFLKLSGLRFVRKMIGLKDEVYNRYIIRGTYVQPVCEAFKRNGHTYNLFNSACIELFEFIRTEDIKSLLCHVAERHMDAFSDVDYVQVFKELRLRYEQHQERAGAAAASAATGMALETVPRPQRFRRDDRQLEEDEEMWFEEDEEEENSAGASTSPPSGAYQHAAAVSPLPQLKVNRTSPDRDFDPMEKYIDNKRVDRERVVNSDGFFPHVRVPGSNGPRSPISIHIRATPCNSPENGNAAAANATTPPTSPTNSPNSPGNSPAPTSPSDVKPNLTIENGGTPCNSPQLRNKRGLVDYELEEDEEDEDALQENHVSSLSSSTSSLSSEEVSPSEGDDNQPSGSHRDAVLTEPADSSGVADMTPDTTQAEEPVLKKPKLDEALYS